MADSRRIGQRIKGRLKNNEGYLMPETLRSQGQPPLYLMLAYWGLSQESAFLRDDPAMAFAICPRRVGEE